MPPPQPDRRTNLNVQVPLLLMLLIQGCSLDGHRVTTQADNELSTVRRGFLATGIRIDDQELTLLHPTIRLVPGKHAARFEHVDLRLERQLHGGAIGERCAYYEDTYGCVYEFSTLPGHDYQVTRNGPSADVVDRSTGQHVINTPPPHCIQRLAEYLGEATPDTCWR